MNLKYLSPQSLTGLVPATIKGIAPSSIASIPSDAFGLLTSGQIAAFTPKQIAALTPDAISTMGADQSSGFTAEQAVKFPAAGISSLSKDAVAALTVNVLKVLPTSTFSQLTSDQIPSLTTKQIAGLSSTQLSSLSIGNIAAFTSEQIQAMTPANFKGLYAKQPDAETQAAVLTPSIISALDTKKLDLFSTSLLESLDAKQISYLSLDAKIWVEKTKGYHILDTTSPDYTTPSANNGDTLRIYTYTTKPILKYATVDSLSEGMTITLYYNVDGSQTSPKSTLGTGKGLLSLDNDPKKLMISSKFTFTDTNDKKAIYKALKVDVNPKNDSVIITLDKSVSSTAQLTIKYEDDPKVDDFYAIQDTLGNDAISFTGIPVTAVLSQII